MSIEIYHLAIFKEYREVTFCHIPQFDCPAVFGLGLTPVTGIEHASLLVHAG